MSHESNAEKQTRALNALSLLYHDVTEAGDFDSSGFTGPAAAHYKLTWSDFTSHMEAIRGVLQAPPVTISDLLLRSSSRREFLLSFDDGGASSMRIADTLAKYGWKAHFFISTDFIGTPGFLAAEQIAELSRQGHIIGSHSCSHPRRMSSCSWQTLLLEWKNSIEVLSQIIAAPVQFASVPGGNSSRQVEFAAAESGIRVLFTSEPTTRVKVVNSCFVLGRYGVIRGISAASAASVAAGDVLPRAKQFVSWKVKMTIKGIAGGYYDRFRDFCFGENSSAQTSRGGATLAPLAKAERKGQ